MAKILERSHGTVELKSDVNEVDLPEKVGADEIAKAKKAEAEAKEAEKAEAKEAEKAEKIADKASKAADKAEGEDK